MQIPWDKNPQALSKWAKARSHPIHITHLSSTRFYYNEMQFYYINIQGQTGYPWIDAIMIQLKKEGWIHCIARHAVACFLTWGDLWLSWEEGMKVR